MTVRARVAVPDEVEAAQRGVLGLTAAVGAMAALTSIAARDPVALVAAPTAALVLLLARGRTPAAAYAAAIVWVTFVGHASGEGLLVPAAMTVVCVAIAIGADRLFGWVRDDFGGRPTGDGALIQGWIEESPDR